MCKLKKHRGIFKKIRPILGDKGMLYEPLLNRVFGHQLKNKRKFNPIIAYLNLI